MEGFKYVPDSPVELTVYFITILVNMEYIIRLNFVEGLNGNHTNLLMILKRKGKK